MLTDYFLKFASREEALQVFSTICGHTYTPYCAETNQPLDCVEICPQNDNFAIDEVGVLYNDDGVYAEDGQVITPPTQIDGHHYNYRVVYGNKPEIPLPTELEPYLVIPEHPQQTFF